MADPKDIAQVALDAANAERNDRVTKAQDKVQEWNGFARGADVLARQENPPVEPPAPESPGPERYRPTYRLKDQDEKAHQEWQRKMEAYEAYEKSKGRGSLFQNPLAPPEPSVRMKPGTGPAALDAIDPALKGNVPPGLARPDDGDVVTDDKSGTLAGRMGGGGMSNQSARALAMQSMGLPRSPETQAAMDAAQESQNEALRQASEHGAMAAMHQAGYARQYQSEQERNQAEILAQRERQAHIENNLLSKWDQMSAAIRSEEIDPNRVWNNKGTTQKIFATVGIALGAALNARTGHGNPALDALDREINNDIQAQVVSMHNKAGRLNDMSQIYPMLVQSGLSDQAAQAGARMVGRDIFTTKLQAAAATAQSREVRDRLALTMSDLQKRQAADKAALEQQIGMLAFRLQHGGPGQTATKSELHQFGDDLSKEGIPSAIADMKRADQDLDTFGTGDVPGIGLMADHLPMPFIKLLFGNEAVANQQSWQGIKNNIYKNLAGVAVNANEAARLERQLDAAHDAASVRRVLIAAREQAIQKYENRAVAAPGAYKQYVGNGGQPIPSRSEPVK